jgi:hypothetical protein
MFRWDGVLVKPMAPLQSITSTMIAVSIVSTPHAPSMPLVAAVSSAVLLATTAATLRDPAQRVPISTMIVTMIVTIP